MNKKIKKEIELNINYYKELQKEKYKYASIKKIIERLEKLLKIINKEY